VNPVSRTDCELAVIGAGPAGLAAATLAAELGVEAVVFDEQPAPGGQIYRNVEANSADGASGRLALLGEDYPGGREIAEAFRRSGAGYEPGTTVWQADAEGVLGVSRGGAATLVRAARTLIATGALERPVPIPGWTLPGVMGAGAAQTLLKASGLVPQVPTVIAGSGPLVYLVARQLVRAGAPPEVLLVTTPGGRIPGALPHLPGALLAGDYLWKGLGWLRDLRRAGLDIRSGVSDLRAEGGERLEAVSFTHQGSTHRLEAGLLLLHEGVVPNVQLSMAAGCAHSWDAAQYCWRPDTDTWGASSVTGIAVAGDGAGILGARAARHLGRLAAYDAACRLSRIDAATRDRQAGADRLALARHRRIRPFLDALYGPAPEMRRPAAADTLVCRCEEVGAGEIRAVVTAGCPGPNQAKAFTRCGMGPCQGRMCGLAVSELIAEQRGVPVAEVGHYRIRFPVKPITVGELAALGNVDTEPRRTVGMPVRPVSGTGKPRPQAR